jgi:nucleoside-diphosphate-sugar epimerase
MSNDKVVLITGATGFIGSRVAKRFVEDGYEVHLLVRPNSSLLELAAITNSVHLHRLDATTSDLIGILKAVQPQSVLHLASLFIAEHNAGDVEPLISSNILFGAQLLEAMKSAGVHRFLNTGTAWQHFHSPAERPSCLYAATKRAFQDVLDYYTDACGFTAITLKIFDTFGPNDPRRKLFWLLRKTAKTGDALSMSLGEQEIDLVYIDDIVEAFRLAEQRLFTLPPSTHEIFGLSSGKPMPLRKVVELYRTVINQPLSIEWGARPYRSREVMTPAILPNLPGWFPKIDLLTGLRQMHIAGNEGAKTS